MWHRSICLALVVSLSTPCAIAGVPGLPPLPSLPVLLKKAKAPSGASKVNRVATPALSHAAGDEYEVSKPLDLAQEPTLTVASASAAQPLPSAPSPSQPLTGGTPITATPSAESPVSTAEPVSASPSTLRGTTKENTSVVSSPIVGLAAKVAAPTMAPPLVEPVKPEPAAEPPVAPPPVPVEAPAATPRVSRPVGPSSLVQGEGYYLPLTCVEFDNSADSVEYQVKKGGVIERKATPLEKKLATFAVSPGETLRTTLKRWAAPDYAFLWEAAPEVDFTFRTAAQFGKDRASAVKALMDAVQGTVGLQLSIYNKNNVWVIRGEIPESLCP